MRTTVAWSTSGSEDREVAPGHQLLVVVAEIGGMGQRGGDERVFDADGEGAIGLDGAARARATSETEVASPTPRSDGPLHVDRAAFVS